MEKRSHGISHTVLRWAPLLAAVIGAVTLSAVLWERAPRFAGVADTVLVLVVLTTLLREQFKRSR